MFKPLLLQADHFYFQKPILGELNKVPNTGQKDLSYIQEPILGIFFEN